MTGARSRADFPSLLRHRWIAPVLLLAIAAGLGPVWWEMTAPPVLPVVHPWRDAAGALLVPSDAVRPQGRGGRVEPAAPASLFVVQDGLARLTPVRLGAVRPDAVEVREGLAEAAQVVVNPPRSLEDRHRVAIRP